MANDTQPQLPESTAAPGDEVAPGTPGSGQDVCPKCHATGQFDGRPCENCAGTGIITRAIGGA